tara:strand:+ start:1758 stop:2396 length:639 start_codon:yes stop_codon:yes gene_type:complete
MGREFGTHYKFEVGPVKVEKTLYRPTIRRFNDWYRKIKDRPWFKNFEFVIVGGFANVINDVNPWRTWDVDIIMMSDYDEKDNLQIRNCLTECSHAALVDFDFFLDIYYHDKTNFYNIEEDFRNAHESIKNGTLYEKKYKHEILQYTQEVKRNDKIVSNWATGEKVIEGLWKNSLTFPSYKQVKKLKAGKIYTPPILLSEYEEIINHKHNIYI